jgi:hypothetical protein
MHEKELNGGKLNLSWIGFCCGLGIGFLTISSMEHRTRHYRHEPRRSEGLLHSQFTFLVGVRHRESWLFCVLPP